MALIKCEECKNEISKQAKICPHCGYKRNTNSLFKILITACGLFVIALIILPDNSKKSSYQKYTTSIAEPNTTITNNNPIIDLDWQYSNHDDKMSSKQINFATIKSKNELAFGSPYSGQQRARLQLRKHPRFGNDVILRIEKGQFICRVRGCNIKIRFDDGKTLTFEASGPNDHDSTTLFIRNYNRFTANLKKSNLLFIEAEFYREGVRIIEFDVSGLQWS